MRLKTEVEHDVEQSLYGRSGCSRGDSVGSEELQLPQRSYITVAQDGTGDYGSIQEAVNAVPDGNWAEVVIRIKAGTYFEKITVPADKTHVTFIGEGMDKTVLAYDDYAGRLQPDGDITGTFRSAALTVRANWFHAQGVTIQNTYDGSQGNGGKQAVACYLSGEHDSFLECGLKGGQDTLYVKEGSHYFKRCFIAGHTDFIFGGARAVFEECTLHSTAEKGYICAPSTPLSQKYGFLFLKCETTGITQEETVFLGRPWHPGLDPYAVGCAVFMDCYLGPHIRREGWTDMGGYLCKNARFYEYGNKGPGSASHEKRRLLTREQANDYAPVKVLGWDPDTERGGLAH